MNPVTYTNTQQGQARRVLPELLSHRQLLMDLVWKELRVRYRYAVMGVAWAIVEPLLLMLVLTFVFSFVFQIRFEGLTGEADARTTALLILSGLIAWQFFSIGVSTATTSLVENRSLITKVHFPREVIPLASIGVALVNAVIGAVIFGLLYCVLLGHFPPLLIVFIPLIALVHLLLVIGLALLCSCLNAQFRDISYIVNALLMFGFYATPIFYEPAFVNARLAERGLESWYPALFINPLCGLITAYREILFYQQLPSWQLLAWPTVCAILVLGVGVKVFRSQSPTLADKL